MKVLDFFDAPRDLFHKPNVTLGMFDGVHRGHQKLLAMLRNGPDSAHSTHKESKGDSRSGDSQSVVITFRDHPMKVLTGRGPLSIVTFEAKLALLEKFGMDMCLVIPFNQEVAQIPPEEFVGKHLIGRLGIGSIVIGENVSFGHKGKGDSALLRREGARHDYRVCVADLSRLPDGSIISSTQVRRAVADGDMARAWAMLGRPFALCGKVVGGTRRGRKLGFPTANIELLHELMPQEGVYAGASEIGGAVYPTLISIGKCPTFTTDGKLQVENHLVGFSGNLYGSILTTFVWERIRDQRTFPDKEALRLQIEKDRDFLLARWPDGPGDPLSLEMPEGAGARAGDI